MSLWTPVEPSHVPQISDAQRLVRYFNTYFMGLSVTIILKKFDHFWSYLFVRTVLWAVGKKHLRNKVARKGEKAKIVKPTVRIHCWGELHELWNHQHKKIQGTRLSSHFTKQSADWQFNPLEGCFHSFMRQRLAECLGLLFSWSHVTELRGRRLGRRTLVISPSAKRTMSHTTGTI